jgi:hypothetical protein
MDISSPDVQIIYGFCDSAAMYLEVSPVIEANAGPGVVGLVYMAGM